MEQDNRVQLNSPIEVEELQWPGLSQCIDATQAQFWPALSQRIDEDTRARIIIKPGEPTHYWCVLLRGRSSEQVELLAEFDADQMDGWLTESELPPQYQATFESLLGQWQSLIGYIDYSILYDQ